MPEPLVRVVGVGRTFGRGRLAVAALVSATCSIAAGERIAIVGPSGSGKSTLLQLIGGLDAPTAGSITWPALGPPKGLRPGRIGFVFQAPSLLDPLSVVENVELPLLLGRVGAGEARRAALAALDRLELGRLAERLPEELSGGQAQQVAAVRALAGRPQLILADEPTGQLDHRSAERVLDALLAALEDADTALVLTTHDLAVAERLDKFWPMRHGVLEATA